MPDDLRHPAVDKSRLPSRHVTVGPERAPHRAFLYSMGLTEAQINQPLVGVATTWNEAAPCNIALARQAQAAKKGVAAARGTPREFTTITVTDGIAMGHAGMKSSLISREIIADSVELTMRGHCYDALDGIFSGCHRGHRCQLDERKSRGDQPPPLYRHSSSLRNVMTSVAAPMDGAWDQLGA